MAKQTKSRSKTQAKKRPNRATPARRRSKPVGPEIGWYRDAVIYELHVRAFADSNGDGIGDFRGLTEKLDYLQDLGVTALWLLPFYRSPLRDDGYDIADYERVHESYGNRRDFKRFVDEAHKRGLKVITELVVNHTSDQHPWFQRARKAPRDSEHRNFYVWTDDPSKYSETRIIFQDFEASNWTYDPEAGQYFWHRFYHHQPDLNFDNPAVHDALFKVMDDWFAMGVDGMRLDAVPYLYEREGTNCENLPETHEFLRKLRTHVDKEWPGRMLLAEANQWPEDSVEYFGDGDECHMSFHFPLMPRLFVSLRMEDRFPIIDILQQTPELPEGCQWAIFLRNHDELTLEMVTDEERDYMYRSYANDRQMRINLGIRRRLSPLLNSDRRKIELLNGLLFSLPGTPVLYYGDEIGMGDNVYLGDRDAVRTPMQWSGDRNAGFSRANPQSLYLPVIIDPEYHYETVNVESQLGNTSSLLWWMKRLIALRKRHAVFGQGDMEFLHPENPKVLCFFRRLGDEHILVVANLSRFAQAVELELGDYEGQTPIEMFGHTSFPQISGEPYMLTMGAHQFFWFRLKSPEASHEEPELTPDIDTRADPDEWLASPAATRWVERHMPRILPERRWFGSKSKSIRNISVDDAVAVPVNSDEPTLRAVLFLVRVEYAEGDDEVYAVPLATADAAYAALHFGESSPFVFGTLRSGDRTRALFDATADEHLWASMLDLIGKRQSIRGKRGELSGRRATRAPGTRSKRISREGHEIRLSRAEQTNSSAIFGDAYIMKLFRRVEEGVNPDFEIGEHFSSTGAFPSTPPLEGAIEYLPKSGQEPVTLAMMQRFVVNEGDAWQYTLDAFGRYVEQVLSQPLDGKDPPRVPDDMLEAADKYDAETYQGDLFDGYLDSAHLLGKRTAEMHDALAGAPDDPAFAPEPFTKLYQRSLYQSMRNAVQRSMQTLRSAARTLPSPVDQRARDLFDRRDEVLRKLKLVADHKMDSVRIRCHGDYHLGQVLWTGRDFCIIDFEGEPMRALGERRLKRSALLDVGGMLRSLQYARAAGMQGLAARGAIPDEGAAFERLSLWADHWLASAQAAFLAGYLSTIEEPIVPKTDRTALKILLDAWLLQKASYELAYELNNRPDWVAIPLDGITSLLDQK